MDFNGWLLSSVSFAGGWLLRGYFNSPGAVEPRVTPCVCDCHCSGPLETPGKSSVPWLAIGLIVLVAIILLVSNFALVCRFTWKDSHTGHEKEIQVNVKGKSKGVLGARKELALTY